jgi:hypothetical protein
VAYYDRMLRIINKRAIALAFILSGIVFALTYGRGFISIVEYLGWAWSLPVAAANVIVWLGVASLVDKRQ